MNSTKPPSLMINQRGIPSNECLSCGSNVQVIKAVFEDYDIVMWFLDSFCAECGSPMTAPCPIDDPERSEHNELD